MGRRKQANPLRTAAEGFSEPTISTPLKEKPSDPSTPPPQTPVPPTPLQENTPLEEWAEIRAQQLETGSIPIAELCLQKLDASFDGGLLSEKSLGLGLGNSGDSKVGSSLRVSLRVPVLRSTVRRPYETAEVVCQVCYETGYPTPPAEKRVKETFPEAEAEKSAEETLPAEVEKPVKETPDVDAKHLVDGARRETALSNGLTESPEAARKNGSDSQTLGTFDGPSSGVSALVDLVWGGLITLQALLPSMVETTQTPRSPASSETSSGLDALCPGPAGTSGALKNAANVQGRFSHGETDSEGGYSHNNTDVTLPTVRVWLLPDAFRDAPTDPCDEQKQRWCIWMQSLMKWVCPDLEQRIKSEADSGGLVRCSGGVVLAGGLSLRKEKPDGREGGGVIDRKGKGKVDESGGVELGPESGGGEEYGQGGFDPKELYAAIKPRRDAPTLVGDFPALLPTLRPYQRRAAAWMVAREQGPGSTSSDGASTVETGWRSHPLWQKVEPVDGGEAFWYNPYTGRLSENGFSQGVPVRGGILADEMGLGKTVELLACILAHPWPGSDDAADRASSDAAARIAQRCIPRVECPCGEFGEEPFDDEDFYPGAWVQCDKCSAWQHAGCVGYVPKKRRRVKRKAGEGNPGLTADDMMTSEGGSEQIADVALGDPSEKDETAPVQDGKKEDFIREGRDALEPERDAMTRGGDAMDAGRDAEQNAVGQNGAGITDEMGLINDSSGSATANGTMNGLKPEAGAGKKRKRGNEAVENDAYLPFTCGDCAALLGGVTVESEVGATLIVCPTSILQQWREEIAKHTHPGAVKVAVYEGVQRAANPLNLEDDDMLTEGRRAPAVVGAHDLAKADVVLTTYEALRADLAHEPAGWGDAGGRSLRRPKRYPVVPTPLTRLTWWRVCLDEAQMVESSTAKATEMALKLKAVNRWCVSGTPIQRGLEDLYGLLKFLQAEPFDSRFWWNRALQGPYEAGHVAAKRKAHVFLRELMWRNSKADVQDEIGLPPQQERIERLRFSATEAHFYRRQHDVVAAQARDVIRKHRRTKCPNPKPVAPNPQTLAPETPADSARPSTSIARGNAPGPVGHIPGPNLDDELLTHAEAAKLMVPLLRLRQACCHPQVGSSGIRSLTQQRTPMTMEEILGVLVEKARVEAEEAQRLMVSSLNGLGGLAMIEGDRVSAIKAYREALQAVEENEVKNGVRADPLQKLHTLHNLALALGYRPNPYSGTALSGGKLERKIEDLAGEVNAKPKVGLRKGDEKENVVNNLAETSRRQVGLSGVSETIVNGHGDRLLGGLSDGDRKGKRKLNDAEEVGKAERKKRRLEGSDDVEIVGGGGFQGVELSPEVPRTLRDDKLLAEAEEIRGRYVAAFQAKLAAVEKEYQKVHAEVLGNMEACRREPGGVQWWLFYLRELPPRNEDALVEYVKEKLLENDRGNLDSRQKNARNLALRFHDVRGLQLVLQSELDAMNASRGALLASLDALSGPPTEELVERAGDCATCHTDMRGEMCAHCAMDELFQNYESRLFKLKANAMGVGMVVTAEDAIAAQTKKFARVRLEFAGGIKGDAAAKKPTEGSQLWDDGGKGLRQGATAAAEVQTSWAPSDPEKILRCILDFMRRNGGGIDGQGAVRAGKKHLDILEGMRREFFKARLFSGAQRALLYALDELGMAVTRVRLRLPGETFESEVEKNVTVQRFEIPGMNARFTTEKFAALSYLQKCNGTLRYLQGLKSARVQASSSAADTAPAPSTPPRVQSADAADVSKAAATVAPASPEDPQPSTSKTAPTSVSAENSFERPQEVPGTGQPATCTGTTGPDQVQPGGSEQTDKTPGSSGQAPGIDLPERAMSGEEGIPSGISQPGKSEATPTADSAGNSPAAESSGDPLPGSDDICPVCQERLGIELVILPCGHMLCCRCAMRMIDQLGPAPSPSSPVCRKLTCPTCRQRAYVGDIAYVNGVAGKRGPGGLSGPEATGGEDRLEVKGSLSTKMDAVVRRILWVSENDTSAKFLIFSTWHDVLDLVAHALRANGVPFERAKGRAGLNPAIKRFRRTGDAAARALLLPFSQGANGLNLVEAQHVILVEPLLNPAAEAQAVGRVHRIGQTRPTFVHRFIIEASVEERVLALGRKKAGAEGGAFVGLRSARKEDALTLGDLGSLFGKDGDEAGIDGVELGPVQSTEEGLLVQSINGDIAPGALGARILTPREAAANAAEARRAVLERGEE